MKLFLDYMKHWYEKEWLYP